MSYRWFVELLCMHGTSWAFLHVLLLLLDSLPSFVTVNVNCSFIRLKSHKNKAELLILIKFTWSPLAYKWANNSPLIKSLALLTTKYMIAFGTMSRVVFVTILIYESTKFLIVSTWRSNCGSSELVCVSPDSCKSFHIYAFNE